MRKTEISSLADGFVFRHIMLPSRKLTILAAPHFRNGRIDAIWVTKRLYCIGSQVSLPLSSKFA
jgi:hypothetical protein